MLIYKMSNSNFNNSKEKFYWGIIPPFHSIKDIFYYMDMSHDPCESLYRYTEKLPAVLHMQINPENEDEIRDIGFDNTADYHQDFENLFTEDKNWYTWEQVEYWYEKTGDTDLIPEDWDWDWIPEFHRLGLKTKNTKRPMIESINVSVNNLKYFKKDLQ